MTQSLKERLLKRHKVYNGRNTFREELWNPDGPAAVQEIERLEQCLRYEQHRAERIGTHAPGCHAWGPRHWECAMEEIERLEIIAMGAEHRAERAEARVAELEAGLRLALPAINASYSQANAEWHGHDRKAAAHDKIVFEATSTINALLKSQEQNDGDE